MLSGFQPSDAIVVLGCRILASGRPSAPAARRAATAAKAYHDGIAPLIIASGGRRWGAQIEASTLRAELLRAGVPRAAILEELWSLTTAENAIFSASILRRLGAARVTLVTCPWHMRRAARNFGVAGIDVDPLPTLTVRAGAIRRAWRFGHEIISERLDAMTMKRAVALHDSLEKRFQAAAGDP